MKRYSFLGIVLAVVLLSWGCKSSGNKSSGHSPITDTVVIKMMQFHPSLLTVNKGDTVVFINHGIVTHDVTDFSGKKWTSGPLKPDSSWKKVITDSLNYYCSIHPTMKGKIRIKKP